MSASASTHRRGVFAAVGVNRAEVYALAVAEVEEGAAPAWHAQAPCRSDPDLFFSETRGGVEAARRECRRCPFQVACLAGAVRRAEQYGVWGGASWRQIRMVRRELGLAPAVGEDGEPVAPAAGARCGTGRHPYADNVVVYANGKTGCRACASEASRRKRERQRRARLESGAYVAAVAARPGGRNRAARGA